MKKNFKLRFAKYIDKKNIMSFIERHWEKNHILSKNSIFFDFQYQHKKDLQFILALDSNNRISGLLGYIQYQPEKNNQDIALALWRVKPNLSDPILGLKLIEYLRENIKHRSIFCVGINKKTFEVYKFLGFQTGKLLHYAAFNIFCKNFSISIPPLKKNFFRYSNNWIFKLSGAVEMSLQKLTNTTGYTKKIPFKSKNYILKRYLNHPYFMYNFYEVYKNNFFLGVVITREVQYFSGKALRIIDVLAEDKNISEIVNEFVIILNQSLCKYEYIDIYASNLDTNLLIKNNYHLVSNSSKIIVPDYFSPFYQKNIDIYFCTTLAKPTCLFKGDGDQDNPRDIRSISNQG